MRTLGLVRTGYISVLLFCSELCLANTWWEVTITDDVMQKCASPRKPGMVLKGSLFLSQNVATEYQCYALCLYTRPCDSFSWQKTVRLCQLRNSVGTPSNLPSLVDKEREYERIAEPLCMDVKHACAHRPCRNYEVCIPVLAAVRHICLPTADLPGAQNAISATDTAGNVDGTVTVMTPHSSTSTSVSQVMTTYITSAVATSFAVTSETTAESSAVTSETTAESSALTGETTVESSAVNSETTAESSAVTSETTAESSAVTSETTTESSAVTSETTTESSALTGETTTESSALTGETTVESSAVTSETTAESSAVTSETAAESSAVTSETTAESSAVTSETTTESSAVTSETTTESSAVTSETTEESSAVTSETTTESSAVTSETTAESSALTSETTAESSAVTSETTAESSALTSETTAESSAVNSEITDKSSALTGASNPPSAATISQQLYNYTYLGCYNDSTARALNETLLTSSTMSHATCFRFCHPYKYAGLEYSDECFCDDVMAPHHTLQDDGNCTSVCPGNSDELCGGYWYIAIYELVQK